ncbi:G-protein coupled receptor 26 [Hoplias malabaricus]|uniref:G-protein coupled receptor 26 n=1 Tax=Hoplias malabaricus TaxID=27720 RepID=UPI003462B76C
MNLWETLLELIIGAIAVAALLSNVLVLLCFMSSAEIRAQVPGIFVLNLSLCNILSATVNMPATALGVAQGGKPFGDAFCWTVSFVDTFLTTNTMLSMAALSIDRWVAVVFPLTYSSKMRYRKAFAMLGYAWLHSLSFSLTPVLLSWTDYSPSYASCTTVHSKLSHTEHTTFIIFTALLHAASFLLSLIVLCLAYLKVLQVARFHCKRIDVVTVQTLLLLVDIHPSVKQRCLLEQKKRRQRATKKICVFIGSFVLCFGPYVITRLAELVPSVKINRHWGVASKCLVYSKAAMDPFVYSLLRQQYRKALIGMTSRILGRNIYSSSGHSSSSDTENECNLPRVN